MSHYTDKAYFLKIQDHSGLLKSTFRSIKKTASYDGMLKISYFQKYLEFRVLTISGKEELFLFILVSVFLTFKVGGDIICRFRL